MQKIIEREKLDVSKNEGVEIDVWIHKVGKNKDRKHIRNNN